LSRLATSFVLGFHGCDEATARKAVLEGADILFSDNDYDWLGPGAYFWESDPLRAREWAEEKVRRGYHEKPAVVGAVIDLGNSLDLVARESVEVLREAYSSFVEVRTGAGLSIPENLDPKGGQQGDRLLRYLDCAVIRHLHATMKPRGDLGIEPFNTVRGMFLEGGAAFPGSGFARKSHVQVAVRNMSCIKGVFYPRN